MIHAKPAAALVALLLAVPDPGRAAAQGDAPPPPDLDTTAVLLRQRALATDHAYDLARRLSLEVGPRLAGSSGDRRALAWAEQALAAAGLAAVRREPVTVPHWERGEAAAGLTGASPQALVLTALGGSVGTPEEGLEAEVAAFPSLDALAAAAPGAAVGKIVFIDRRMRRTRDFSGYREAQPARTAGAIAAARQGASAILIRSVGTSDDRLPHTGRVRYEAGVPAIPAAALAPADADLLAARLAAAGESGAPVRVWMRLTTRLLPDAESANVVAEVRGRELPEEIVLLGAHLDSWDLGQGAEDDAAGVGVVVAAARLLAELPRPPRRTVRVVLYANEEFGLTGADAYAERHRDELPRHVAAMEADHGSAPVYELGSLVPPERRPLVEAVAQLLAPLGVARGGERADGGADLRPLHEAGIPILSLDQDSSRYFDVHHTANDTFDKLDREGLRQVVAAYAVAAWVAAEMDLEAAPAASGAAGPGR